MTMTVLAIECMHQLTIALKQFGEHAFFDKGPGEIMDIPALAKKFRTFSPDYAVETFRYILKGKQYGKRFASAILNCLENWDELWDAHGDFLETFY